MESDKELLMEERDYEALGAEMVRGLDEMGRVVDAALMSLVAPCD